MRKSIRRKHEAHRRAQAVCEQNRSVIEASDGGKATFAKFNASFDDVDQLFAAQRNALNDRRKAQEQLVAIRRTLRDIMKAVVGVSASVTLDEGSAKVMQLPDIGTDELLQADATAIYNVASAHAAAFLAVGLPSNTIADLRDQIALFVKTRKASSTARRAYTTAIKASLSALRTGDITLKVMDAILAQTTNVDPQAVQALRLARRIGYDHNPSAKPAAAPGPVPTAPAATADPAPTPAAQADPVPTAAIKSA